MKKIVLMLLMLVLLVVPVGCGIGINGNGGNGNNGDVANEPWELYTEEEAESLLGFDVEPDLQKLEDAGQKLVYYGDASGEKEDFVQVAVTRDEDMSDSLKESGNNVAKLFEQIKQDFPDNEGVESLGKEAFWANNALHILEDGVYVAVSTGATDAAEGLERAKEIAATAMDRLGL